MDVYNRIIHNVQKVEAAKMFFDRTSSRGSSNCTKPWYIYIMKYNSVPRRNKLSSHEMTWRKQMHITK